MKSLDFRDPVRDADSERRDEAIVYVKLPLYALEFGSIPSRAALSRPAADRQTGGRAGGRLSARDRLNHLMGDTKGEYLISTDRPLSAAT
jgi:hypothetical protein